MSACIVFDIQNPNEAYNHMDLAPIIQYGKSAYNHPLHVWDDGERYLCKCKNCGGYVLVQESEYHGIDDDDYYIDYIKVENPEEADEINKKYSGSTLEIESGIKYLAKTGNSLVWRN